MVDFKDRAYKYSSLRLDLRNPRLGDGIGSEDEAIAALHASLARGNEVVAMAKSILNLGGLDP